MPKSLSHAARRKERLKRAPLGSQMEADRLARPRRRRVGKGSLKEEAEEEYEEEAVVGGRIGRRILRQARQLQDEVEGRGHGGGGGGSGGGSAEWGKEEEEEEEEVEELVFDDDMPLHFDGEAVAADVSADEERALSRFLNPAASERRNLADIIMEKIREHEEGTAAGDKPYTNPKVVRVYHAVGKLMRTYRSGRLPKPMKIIPALKEWEHVLMLTQPDQWTPAAMFAATRIFASNLNYRMAQRFYNLILLPRVRDDISTEKKLNYHLYMALKKALFKPQAFFKGVLLPLAEGGDCTLREATIISSVLARVSIPVQHSSAALMKLALMPYSGTTSMFIRVLLDKRYSLPFAVIDALVEHFRRFIEESRALPLMWHRSLLVFVQRYKGDLLAEQKEVLKAVMRAQHHYAVTPEVRRELFSAAARGEDDSMDLEDGM